MSNGACDTANADASALATRSHVRAGAHSRNGGIRATPLPRVHPSADTPNAKSPAFVPASTIPPTPSRLLKPVGPRSSPEASSSKVRLDMGLMSGMEGVKNNRYQPHERPQHSLLPRSVPSPLQPPQPSRASRKGKEKEVYPSGSGLAYAPPTPTKRGSSPAAVLEDEFPSDAETEVADNSLSTTATEIVPFSPQLPKRLNLPPRKIPTPPLPPVRVIDFAYRPKPSLKGLPERPIDPKWVVPRVPMPPECEGLPPMQEVKRKWVQQWEAAQDQPGGIYRTGRNRVDGTPNPPPVISAIVTREGVRGYTSQGWISPSLKNGDMRIPAVGLPRPHMKGVLAAQARLKSKRQEDKDSRQGTSAACESSVSASRALAPVPLLRQPVPRRPVASQEHARLHAAAHRHAESPPSTPLPGRKRRRGEAELETETDDTTHMLGTDAGMMTTRSKAQGRPRTKSKPDAKATTDKASRNPKARGASKDGNDIQMEDVAPPAPSPPRSRYALRSRYVGKGG